MAGNNHGFRNAVIGLSILVLGLVMAWYTVKNRHILTSRFMLKEGPIVAGRQAAPSNIAGGLLVFTGRVGSQKLALSPAEEAEITRSIQDKAGVFQRIELDISADTHLSEIRPETELGLELTLLMRDGSTYKPPYIRATRGDFVEKLVWRLNHDAAIFLKTGAAAGGPADKPGTVTNSP